LTAGWLLHRPPEPQSWSGVLLGGPEIALDPRASPDGSLIAFQAMEEGITQVAVMKPETGNWSVLTHNRKLGPINSVAWSPDGASVYYDRQAGGYQGIFSVPVLGGDERLIVENAGLPESLPDGGLLIAKYNAQRQLQYFRFRPDGKLEGLPVISTEEGGTVPRPRASPDGKQAALFGRVLGHETEGIRLLLVDLTTGSVKPLLPSTQNPSTWTFARSGKAILAGIPAV